MSVSKRSLMLRNPAGGEGGVMPSRGCLFLSRAIFLVRLVGTILVGRKTTWAGVVDRKKSSDLLIIGSLVVVALEVDVDVVVVVVVVSVVVLVVVVVVVVVVVCIFNGLM